jgi:hypothetical protein
MGLDVTVYCNCVESGRITVPHPYPPKLYIDSSGSPEIRTEDMDEMLAHDRWQCLPPCEHREMKAFECRIGNGSHVARLRKTINSVFGERDSEYFPVLLGKVLYNGTHCGDHLSAAQASELALELTKLPTEKPDGIRKEDWLEFEGSVADLTRACEVSSIMNKPIAF